MRSRRVMHGEETVIMGSVFSSSNETNDRDAYVGYLDLGHDDLPPSPRPDATADPDLPWYLRFPKNRAEQAGVDAYAPIADQIRKNKQARVLASSLYGNASPAGAGQLNVEHGGGNRPKYGTELRGPSQRPCDAGQT